MSIGVIVEVVIGVLFVWILLALITSQVSDWAASLFKWRSDMLEDTIKNMLGCESMCMDFYSHPLIKGLHTGKGKRKPSYIPNNQFALVVFDLLIKAGTEDSQILKAGKAVEAQAESIFAKLRTAIHKIGSNPNDDKQGLARALETLLIDVASAGDKIQDADQALAQARKRTEAWFDNAMERLSGAYKRRAQFSTIVIGMVLAFSINADSLAIANALWTQPLVREAIVAQAEQFQLPQEETDTPAPEAPLEYVNTLQGLSLPIGWAPENVPSDFNGWFVKLGGILLSGAAAAQGAPFWFEILRKVLNFRAPVPSKDEK
ncbi:MAG: hypothetical protein Fur0022_29120 [Anaerolineales bacterium]